MKYRIADILSFIKTLNLKKISNYLKLICSYYYSLVINNVKYKGIPGSLAIEVSANCNLNCLECPAGKNNLARKGDIDTELFKETIDKWHKHLYYLMLYFQGEPFMNKNIFELIKYCSNKKIYTAISSNGHFLSEEYSKKIVNSGLNRIIISIDGINKETYEKYRIGGNFDKLIRGIKTLVKTREELKKKNPYIILQFIVTSANEHQADSFKDFAMSLGADRAEIKTAQIYNYKDNPELIPKNNKYSRYYKDKSGNYKIKSKLKNKCKRMWLSPVINNKGEVLVCCFDKNCNYIMGNIKNQLPKKITRSKHYKDFRIKILSNRKNVEMCRNCTEGLKLDI